MKLFTQEHLDYVNSIRNQFPEKLKRLTDHPLLRDPDQIKHGLVEIWESRYFAVRVVKYSDKLEKLGIHRVTPDIKAGTWEGNISWDEIQELKNQCGRGDKLAIEIYPPDDRLINEGNFRHIWVIDETLPYLWANIKKSFSPLDN